MLRTLCYHLDADCNELFEFDRDLSIRPSLIDMMLGLCTGSSMDIRSPRPIRLRNDAVLEL